MPISVDSPKLVVTAKNYVKKMIDEFGIDRNSKVCEIAANDGSLLQYFQEKNIPCFGWNLPQVRQLKQEIKG